jgi:sarcosine oxidase, subunit gamma
MAEQLARTHPLEAWSTAFDELPDGLRITPEPFVAMVDVRVGAGGPAAVRGTRLPTAPNTWTPTDDGRLVWLGPDEWLLMSTGAAPEALEAEVREELRPGGGTAVDVSAQRIVVRISGPRARDVLVTGCSVDLHPRAFPPGSSAQTTLGQAGVVLLALAPDDFAVLVRSSFAGYLATWLLDASLEHTVPTDARP